MTPELRQHLTDWYQWATGDAVDGEPFSRSAGLCVNAPCEVRDELKALLFAELGDHIVPFGRADYAIRSDNRTQHLCPKRLAWVASKIGAA